MSNNLRTRNGMPFNFVNGLKVRGMDIESLIPGIEGIPEAGSKYQFAGNGVNKVFTLPVTPYNKDAIEVHVKQLYVHSTDYTLVGDTITLAEAPPAVAVGETYNVEIKVNLTTLNGYVDASRVSFEGENLDDILEKSKPLANYSQLRAYTGNATQVRITYPGIAGFFQRLGTLGLNDNGGTVIIDIAGRAWVRIFSGAVNILWFGGVPDYIGTPQYDGFDATRITATDNAEALRAGIFAAIYHSTALYIPSGHYGSKTPSTEIDLIGKDITIYGDGKDASVLDFIYEDESGTVYTTDTAANFMLRIMNGGTVVFRDIHIKATTNKRVVRGLVNSAAAVYYSKIFGVLVKNCVELHLVNTKASRFNGKGFATDGLTKFKGVDITGEYCTWSPYWIEGGADCFVHGGELSYCGYLGNPSTGYGITFNRDCGVVHVSAVKAHHNYRKGIDTHGTHRYYVNECVFEDNLFAHVAAVNVQGNTGLTNGVLSVARCTMSNGATADSEDWLRVAYQAAFANGFTDHGHRACILSDGPSQAELLEFIGNTVDAAYCGNDIMTSASEGLIYLYSQSGRIFFKDNVMPLKKYGINSSIVNSAYAYTPIHMSAKRYVVDNNHVTYTASAAFTGTNGADFGGAYSFGVTDSATWPVFGSIDVEFTRNTTNLNNAKLLSTASSTRTFALRFLNDYAFKMHNNVTSLMVRKSVNGDLGGWFSDIGYLEQHKASMVSNAFIVNGTSLVWDWVRGRVNKKHARSGSGFSKLAGAAVARVIVDGVAALSNIELLVFSGARPNPVTIWIGSPATSNSQIGTDPNFTYSVNPTYTDSDGVSKIAITINTINSLSSLFVSASLSSLIESYGIERVDIL